MSVKSRANFAHQSVLTKTTLKYGNGENYPNPDYSWDGARYTSETSTGTRRRKPKGWIDPTPYTFLRRDYQGPLGSCRYNTHTPYRKTGQWYEGRVGGLPGDTGTSGFICKRFTADTHYNLARTEAQAQSDLGLRNAALIAVRQKLKSTKVNLGVAYGERKATTKLLGDTAIRLANSFKALKRGNVRRAMDELGISSRKSQPRGSNVPNKWLELQYGWNPLLSDCYGAADALSKRPLEDWKVTAKVTRQRTDQYVGSIVPNVSLTSGYDACQVACVVKRSVFARIDAVPQNELLISLASLGVTNPLIVAWELTYLSFVVDWFYNLGGYLESLDAMLGYEGKAYSSSLLVRANWVDIGTSHSIPGGAEISNNYVGTKSMVYLKRETSVSPPIPTLPSFKDPVSLGHMANGLALLAGAFGRR